MLYRFVCDSKYFVNLLASRLIACFCDQQQLSSFSFHMRDVLILGGFLSLLGPHVTDVKFIFILCIQGNLRSSQPVYTCAKLKIETPEQFVKFV